MMMVTLAAAPAAAHHVSFSWYAPVITGVLVGVLLMAKIVHGKK